jgi:DNA-binding beta-propeller fold protein YncE
MFCPSGVSTCFIGVIACPLVLSSLAALAIAQVDPYPRIDAAISYEVDPSWPKRPPGVEWGHVPGVAVDRQDNVWVFTRAKPPVQVYKATDGTFVRSFGEQEIGKAHHLKIDQDGNVWVTDIARHLVMQFSPGGQLLRQLGTPDEAGDDETHFNMPTDVAIAPSGDVFVADGYGNNRVVHYDSAGKFVKAWGTLGVKPGQFSLPHAIALDSRGRLYVADRNNVRIQVFDTGGKLLDVWSNVITPWGFCLMPNDDLWVCGSSPMTWVAGVKEPLGCPPKDQLFARFTPAGKLVQMWTVPKGTDGNEKPGELNWVHGMAVDSQGNIYAGDIIGQRIQKFVRRNAQVD